MDRLSLEDVRDRLRAFVAARDWEQFHSPRNLALSVMIEAAELGEHFQWCADGGEQAAAAAREEIALEMADVMHYLLRLADRLDVDLLEACMRKLAINEQRYPVERSRGRSTKYDRL